MREILGYVAPDVNELNLPWHIEKPWGHEEVWAHTEDYVGKILYVKAGQRLSFQYHRIKEETIRLLEGIVDVEYTSGDLLRTVRMKPGDVHHIPPSTRHRFKAVEDCRILEVSTPYLGDIVRLEDDYGRTGDHS
jgi:mannose-6-phosphate isomerase-like protein (cupin superfamily)